MLDDEEPPDSDRPPWTAGEMHDGSLHGILRCEDREEYEDLLHRFEQGLLVPVGSVLDLERRIALYLAHKYIEGRDRERDAEWLVASGLTRIDQICMYYSRPRRCTVRRRREEPSTEELERMIELELEDAA